MPANRLAAFGLLKSVAAQDAARALLHGTAAAAAAATLPSGQPLTSALLPALPPGHKYFDVATCAPHEGQWWCMSAAAPLHTSPSPRVSVPHSARVTPQRALQRWRAVGGGWQGGCAGGSGRWAGRKQRTARHRHLPAPPNAAPLRQPGAAPLTPPACRGPSVAALAAIQVQGAAPLCCSVQQLWSHTGAVQYIRVACAAGSGRGNGQISGGALCPPRGRHPASGQPAEEKAQSEAQHQLPPLRGPIPTLGVMYTMHTWLGHGALSRACIHVTSCLYTGTQA